MPGSPTASREPRLSDHGFGETRQLIVTEAVKFSVAGGMMSEVGLAAAAVV